MSGVEQKHVSALFEPIFPLFTFGENLFETVETSESQLPFDEPKSPLADDGDNLLPSLSFAQESAEREFI